MAYTVALGAYDVAIVDIIIFVICMISAVVCCIKGFVEEFSHQAGIIAGLACGLLFTKLLSAKLSEALPTFPAVAIALLSFVILSLVGYFLLRFLGNAVKTIVESFHLGALDNILGFAWGLLCSLFSLSVLMYVLSLQSFLDFSPFFDASLIANTIIKPLLPEAIDVFQQGLKAGSL